MHHVKNDKRSITSANAIYHGLLSLLETQTCGSITVSAICEVANVSRATFYRNFDFIEDIMIWYGDNLIRKLIKDYFENPEIHNNKTFMQLALQYALEESGYLETLVSCNKLHLLEMSVYHVLDHAPLNFNPLDNPNYKYAIAGRAGFFFGIIHCWAISGKKESINQLVENLIEIEKLTRTMNFKSPL